MSDQLAQAIKSIRAGDRESGKQLLIEVLRAEPQNDMAWLWMSAVVDTDDMRRECLEEALRSNPNNQPARKGLAELEAKRQAGAAAQAGQEAALGGSAEGEELPFKFRYVRNQQTRGLFSKKGKATHLGLLLGDELLGYRAIVDTTSRDSRIVIALSRSARLSEKLAKACADGRALALEIYGLKAQELERYIDRICSKIEIERRQEELAATGRSDLFNAITCPECQASIDLSEVSESPYVYCRFCESILTTEGDVIARGSVYRTCDECGMFGRIQGYTEFYFYFILVAYGFSWKRRFLCETCADKVFRKTLLLNLLFVIGILPSVAIKVRSFIGRDPRYRRLAKANKLALKGYYEKAAPLYDRLYKKYPDHPGLLMNQGIAHLLAEDTYVGSDYVQRSLKACSNYVPAARLMR